MTMLKRLAVLFLFPVCLCADVLTWEDFDGYDSNSLGTPPSGFSSWTKASVLLLDGNFDYSYPEKHLLHLTPSSEQSFLRGTGKSFRLNYDLYLNLDTNGGLAAYSQSGLIDPSDGQELYMAFYVGTESVKEGIELRNSRTSQVVYTFNTPRLGNSGIDPIGQLVVFRISASGIAATAFPSGSYVNTTNPLTDQNTVSITPFDSIKLPGNGYKYYLDSACFATSWESLRKHYLIPVELVKHDYTAPTMPRESNVYDRGEAIEVSADVDDDYHPRQIIVNGAVHTDWPFSVSLTTPTTIEYVYEYVQPKGFWWAGKGVNTYTTSSKYKPGDWAHAYGNMSSVWLVYRGDELILYQLGGDLIQYLHEDTLIEHWQLEELKEEESAAYISLQEKGVRAYGNSLKPGATVMLELPYALTWSVFRYWRIRRDGETIYSFSERLPYVLGEENYIDIELGAVGVYWKGAYTYSGWVDSSENDTDFPGIGWAYCHEYPYLYLTGIGDEGEWVWIYNSTKTSDASFFAYSTSEGYWFWASSLWGWGYRFGSNPGWFEFRK